VYRERAEDVVRSVRAALEQVPMGFGSTLIALDFLLHPPVEIAIAGDLEAPETRGLLARIHCRFLPARVIAGHRSPVPAEVAQEVPLLAGKQALAGRPAAYVCRDFACRAPTSDPEALAAQLPFVAVSSR
jgi:hypothetical protein